MTHENTGKESGRRQLPDIVIPIIIALLMATVYLFTISRNLGVIDGTVYLSQGDDVYISMRYARHFSEGHGFAWNIGQEPVEGFTNLLWTLWIAFLMLFKKDPGILLAASSALLHIGTVILMFRFLRKKIGSSPVLSSILCVLLAFWSPILRQAKTGLENPLLLFLFVLSMYLLVDNGSQRKQLTAGAWIAGLLPLVRPSGLYYSGMLFILFGFQYIWPERDNLVAAVKKWKWLLPGFFAPFFLYTLFRVFYFGSLLPNTYYLKVPNRPGRVIYGARYVLRFLREFYGTAFLIPVVLYALFRKNRLWVKVLTVTMLGNLAYVAYQGGDAWFGWRFMLIFLPIYLVVLASVFVGERGNTRGVKVFLWGVLATMCFWAVKPDLLPAARTLRGGIPPVKTAEKFESPAAYNTRLGLLLKEVCDKDAVIADFWAGAVPYYSGLATIDMLGKSDKHIARRRGCRNQGLPGHDKFDFDYVVGLKPDVILSRHRLPAGTTEGGLKRMMRVKKKGMDPAGAYLLLNERFREEYEPVKSVLSSKWRAIYVRKGTTKVDLDKLKAMEGRFLK